MPFFQYHRIITRLAVLMACIFMTADLYCQTTHEKAPGIKIHWRYAAEFKLVADIAKQPHGTIPRKDIDVIEDD